MSPGTSSNHKASEKSRSVIDPEALILASLCLIDDEPRLADIVASWTIVNSNLLSVQRINNLTDDYPAIVTTILPGLAKVAHEHGKDARWKALFNNETQALQIRSDKIRSVRARLDNPPALLLRLRGIFGLGIRPEVVAFLMRKQQPEQYEDASTIADATGYARNSVKRVLDSLAEAGGLSRTDYLRDPGYSIAWSPMFRILDSRPEKLPMWRYCHQSFTMVLDYLNSSERFTQASSDFMLQVESSKFIERHKKYLIASGIGQHQNMDRVSVAEMMLSVNKMMDTFF